MSNEPGASADVAALTRLFHREAFVFGAQDDAGRSTLRVTPLREFLHRQGAISATAFYECEVFRSVKQHEAFATVYSVVESRSRRGGPPDFTGINSLQLHFSDGKWRIVSLYYSVPSKAAPVPLEGGKSGHCLDGTRG